MVQACRYAGLLDESLKAHDLAHRLDRSITTTVMNTHFAMGRHELLLSASTDRIGYMNAMALDALGRRDEALEFVRQGLDKDLPPTVENTSICLCDKPSGCGH